MSILRSWVTSTRAPLPQLAISFGLMLVVGLGNRIFSILTYNDQAMAPVRELANCTSSSPECSTELLHCPQNFSLFVNLITTFIFIPVGVPYIIVMARYRPDVITPEALRIPIYVWAISEVPGRRLPRLLPQRPSPRFSRLARMPSFHCSGCL